MVSWGGQTLRLWSFCVLLVDHALGRRLARAPYYQATCDCGDGGGPFSRSALAAVFDEGRSPLRRWLYGKVPKDPTVGEVEFALKSNIVLSPSLRRGLLDHPADPTRPGRGEETQQALFPSPESLQERCQQLVQDVNAWSRMTQHDPGGHNNHSRFDVFSYFVDLAERRGVCLAQTLLTGYFCLQQAVELVRFGTMGSEKETLQVGKSCCL